MPAVLAIRMISSLIVISIICGVSFGSFSKSLSAPEIYSSESVETSDLEVSIPTWPVTLVSYDFPILEMAVRTVGVENSLVSPASSHLVYTYLSDSSPPVWFLS